MVVLAISEALFSISDDKITYTILSTWRVSCLAYVHRSPLSNRSWLSPPPLHSQNLKLSDICEPDITKSDFALNIQQYGKLRHTKELINLKLTLAQPPKRRGGAASSAPAPPKRGRASKLAKENNITAEEENEIKEVFHIFSDKNKDFPEEKEGVIPREDVRKALV
jgi:hypothetical protein